MRSSQRSPQVMIGSSSSRNNTHDPSNPFSSGIGRGKSAPVEQGLGQTRTFSAGDHPYNPAEVLTKKIALAHVEFRRTYECHSRPCSLSILSPPASHLGGPTVCQEMVDPPGTTIDWRSE